MATYFFLQKQALQGDGCTAQAQQVSPVAAPFPSLDPAAAFRLEPKRSGSLPSLAPCGCHPPMVTYLTMARMLIQKEAKDPLWLVVSGHYR